MCVVFLNSCSVSDINACVCVCVLNAIHRAIGTGLTATPDIAQSVHAAIRKWLRRQYGMNNLVAYILN